MNLRMMVTRPYCKLLPGFEISAIKDRIFVKGAVKKDTVITTRRCFLLHHPGEGAGRRAHSFECRLMSLPNLGASKVSVNLFSKISYRSGNGNSEVWKATQNQTERRLGFNIGLAPGSSHLRFLCGSRNPEPLSVCSRKAQTSI